MTTSTIRAALERLIELEDTASANGADPDTTAWDEAVATGRAVLKAEPEGEGPSLADVDELCAEFGFHPDDDQGEGLEILSDMITAAIARWGAPVVKPATPPAPEQPLSSLMAQELAKAEQRHGRFDASETIERLGRCHSAMSARGDVQSAALCQHAATLLQQQTAELAALRKPPHPTFLDAIRLAQGCHDYSGGHSGKQKEAFQDGVGTVVAVLKKAAVGS